MTAISRSVGLNLMTNVEELSAPLSTLQGYMRQPPVTFYGALAGQKNVVPQVGSMTIWSAETLTLETWVQNEWGKHALYAATPNSGDALTYNALTSLWQPTPINAPIINSLKVYNDSTSILEVKRYYSGNALTNTSGLTTGTMTPSGAHTLTGGTNTTYRITIDTTGAAADATFKWSNDAGATYQAFNVPMVVGTAAGRKVLTPILLENGVYVTFGNGAYTSGDYWSFVAIAASNQLYDLQVDTTNSIVKVGATIQIANDSSFSLWKASSTVLNFKWDSTGGATQFSYDRTLRNFSWSDRGNSLISFWGGTTGAGSTAFVGVDAALQLPVILTPATPPAGIGRAYQKGEKPYWLDSGGVESIIPQAAKAETITGTWSFTAANITTSSITTLSTTTIKAISSGTTRIAFNVGSPSITLTGDTSIIGAISASTTVSAVTSIDSAIFQVNTDPGFIRDNGATARVTIGTASPEITLTGDVKFATAAAKLMDSAGGTKITVATTGVTIPTLLGAVTASGAWTFSAAGTALTVTNNALVSGTLTVTSGIISSSWIINPDFYDALFGTVRIHLATTSPHVKLTGDTTTSGYLNVGVATAPTNTAAGDLTYKGKETATPSAQQSIAVSAPIVANARIVQISTTTAANMTATPTIADGADGQIVTVVNTGTNTFTIQDQGTLASSNLRLVGATFAVATRDNITLMYNAAIGDWVEIARSNVT